ncbi:MAG: hypothetical protein K0R67_2424, partial [Paenibacillus sp.]|nr:hypothetical protein [Paenibacillus sp.]
QISVHDEIRECETAKSAIRGVERIEGGCRLTVDCFDVNRQQQRI